MFAIATTITMCVQAKYGMGRHITSLSRDEVKSQLMAVSESSTSLCSVEDEADIGAVLRLDLGLQPVSNLYQDLDFAAIPSNLPAKMVPSVLLCDAGDRRGLQLLYVLHGRLCLHADRVLLESSRWRSLLGQVQDLVSFIYLREESCPLSG